MRIVIVLLLAVLMVGCNPAKYCPKHGYEKNGGDTTIRRDSVIYKDSLVPVFIPADSSSLQAYIECQGNVAKLMGIISYQGGQHTAPPKVVIRDNILYVNCNVNEWDAFIKVRSSEVYKDVYKARVYVKITNILKGWQVFLMWVGGVLIIVVSVYAGVKYLLPLIRKAILKV